MDRACPFDGLDILPDLEAVMLLGSALEEDGLFQRLHYTCDFSKFLEVLQAAGDRCQPAISRLRAWLSTQVQA